MLLTVLDFEEDSWVAGRMQGYSWLNMMLSGDGTVIPTKWRDGTPIEYQNWREGAPWSSEPPQLCTKIIVNRNDPIYNGQCANVECKGSNNMVICKQTALKGPVIPPSDLPDVPPQTN